ncbi:MAG: hypothetical protein WC565_07970 [Parcubacteria group bacterium]
MKALVAIYLTCLGVAALVFAIFPAEDTYINPIEIVPVERVIETRVETQAAPVEVNPQVVVELQSRVEAVENTDDAWRADADRRIRNATDYAVSAVTDADTLWTKVAAVEEGLRTMKRRETWQTWIFVALWGLGYVATIIALWRSGEKSCAKGTTKGTTPPTSAGTPTKR